MNTIIIKSLIDTPTYSLEKISIPEPENLFRKIVRKITKEPRKEHKFSGGVSYNYVKMTIIDEIDVKEWMQVVGTDYKKKIQVVIDKRLQEALILKK